MNKSINEAKFSLTNFHTLIQNSPNVISDILICWYVSHIYAVSQKTSTFLFFDQLCHKLTD